MSDSETPKMFAAGAFPWACLGVVCVALGWIGWCINDLRIEFKQSAQTIRETAENLNRDLPLILENTKRGTEAAAILSQDVKDLRNLAGITSGAKDKSVPVYADSVLDLIASQKAVIGRKKLIGKGLKDEQPATDWVQATRRQSLVRALFFARNKQDMLESICKTFTGGDWYIRFPDKEPVKLIEWVTANHEASRELAPRSD